MSPVKLSFIVLSIVSCFAIMAFTENGIGNVCWDTNRHLATNFQMPARKPQEHHGQTLQMNPAKEQLPTRQVYEGADKSSDVGTNETIRRMEKPGKRPNVTPGKPGSGWSYSTRHYKVNGEDYQEFWLDVPEISFQYQGQEYSIGGSSVHVVAKWVDDLPFNSEKEGTIFAQYEKDFQGYGYDIKLSNNLESSWKKFLYNEWGSDIDQIPPLLPNVRHEIVHLLVERKYYSLREKHWGEKSHEVYHFIHEMMAHMGGEGMSKEEALSKLITAPAYASFREITLDYMADQAGYVLDKLNQHPNADALPAQQEQETNIQSKHENMNSLEKTSKSGIGVRGWCHCPNRSAHVTRGNLVRMGEDFRVADYSYFFCTDCYKCRKDLDNVDFLIQDGPIHIWDVAIAKENGYKRGTLNLDDNTTQLLIAAQENIMQIPDDEVVIHGLCHCSMPTRWIFAKGTAQEIEMCKDCGKPLAVIPYNEIHPKTTRKLRRCTTGVNVCRCKEETGIYPQFFVSPRDDGDVTFALNCNKCFSIKYSASVPMREFKNKFADREPTPEEFYTFMIGTDDLNAAIEAADQEAK